MTEHEKAEEIATAYALERSPTVQCPACGEETHWPHHKEDWLVGFRAAEAGMNDEVASMTDLVNDTIERNKMLQSEVERLIRHDESRSKILLERHIQAVAALEENARLVNLFQKIDDLGPRIVVQAYLVRDIVKDALSRTQRKENEK